MNARSLRTRDADERPAAGGNERLTALASGVLLVLLSLEVLTVPSLHALIAVHLFVGVFLAVPLAVKIGSVGYRFVRYYTGSPAFVSAGPPSLGLRVLAPLLFATTVVLVGSGLALLAVAPGEVGLLRVIHIFSFLVWMPMVTVHLFAHFRQVPHVIAQEWKEVPAEPTPGRRLRLGVILGALVAGALLASLGLVVAAPWIDGIKAIDAGPGPFVVGVVAAALALLASELLKRR